MTQEITFKEAPKDSAIWGRAMLTMLVSKVAMKAPTQTANKVKPRFLAGTATGAVAAAMFMLSFPVPEDILPGFEIPQTGVFPVPGEKVSKWWGPL